MLRSQKRLLLLIGALPLLLLAAAALYMFGMAYFEGEERDFWRSLSWAAETLSTTGYGADTRWNSPVMVIFVVVLQFLGVFLVFLIFPIYLIPFLEERFEARLPKTVPRLSGHVVIFRSGAAVATLLDELSQAGVETLVLEEDEAAARRQVELGRRVLVGGIDDDILERAHLMSARSLVANSTDDEDATITLAARQMGFSGEILALVEEPFHRQPIILAGATAAYTPRHVLGAVLAARASRRVSPSVAGVQSLGRKIQVSEVRIGRDSKLAGKTLAEAELGKLTGATVIGQWRGGRLEAPVHPGTRLSAGAILVLVGSFQAIERFRDLCRDDTLLPDQGPFVIAGFGEVGGKVAQLLRDAGEEVVVIDRRAPGADIVGDVLDPTVLKKAGVGSAQAVILALDTDSATLFATVILKDVAAQVPVIARVNRAENVDRIHRAGAEFAQSISQVSGQILARRLLGEASVSIDPQLKVMQVRSDGLVGKHPASLGIRAKTGCSVVAVERGSEVITQLGGDFVFEPEDTVYVCGSNEATRLYTETFGGQAAVSPGGALATGAAIGVVWA